ncbi:MAG: RNA polymerase-associated protein RapA [Candidatus Argoarchaeum ethanivorans]|uniref:RNA polymerase-associated protein RapA n=1 Tax=Candidatus Argoarchaeum ethanivorans TaxID=2608793 RepID=A0A811T5E6_9EURY|nr:MAG: RNA polymerase-associated protein RapA [Candidatus Argoarchaeum ethanivorans]
MLIPPKIIDNSEGNTLASFLNEVLEAKPDTKLDVASAFFDVRAYSMVKDNLNDVSSFKLLLGKAPEIKSDRTLGKELLRMIGEEVEGLDLTKEDEFNVKNLIEFLKRDDVKVRLYEKEFLHGKAYIFENLVVIGSSNFTVSGLTHNTELNSVSLDSEAVYTRERWFNQFWKDARDFKAELIELLENSRYGSREYTPYEIYIKALYELQKEEIIAEKEEKEEKKRGLPSSKVNLAEFQADTIKRIFSRFKKYGGVLLADSVGLGKTWIAKKVLEDIGYYERKNVLVICPAQLRGMWRDEMRSITVTESILSQEEMASSDFLDRATRLVPNVTDIELIVVDESHNFRNPLSNRWENFFTLVNDHISSDGKKPYILFLTATPINNTIWDLYWQVMLMVSMDRSAFVKENIPDLFEFFKNVDKKENPSLLGDLLNEISIRRNRDYIKKNHPDAYILKKLPDGVEIEQKIEFPTRTLETINYELGETYQGMYKEIADVITDKLTMAYYRILQYKKEEELTEDEELTLGRMIALEGIFRTILLKRLESSVNAFRISIDRHVNFLTKLKAYLSQGKLLTKKSFNKHVISFDDELDDFVEELEGL